MYSKGNLVSAVFNDFLKKKILEDPDFIRSAKNGNSLIKYLSQNQGEIKDKTIARLLMLSEEEVEKIYLEAVEMLKKEVT